MTVIDGYFVPVRCLNCREGAPVEHVADGRPVMNDDPTLPRSESSVVLRCTRCKREHHLLNVLRLMSEVR